MKVAGAGTKRIRRQGGEAIDAAYGGIENFSAKCRNLSEFVGICRNLSEFVGICRNSCLKFWGGVWYKRIEVSLLIPL